MKNRHRTCRPARAAALLAALLAWPSAAFPAAPPAAAPDMLPSAAAMDTTELARLLWSASTLQRVLAERDYTTALLLGLAGREWAPGTDAAAGIATLVERARTSRGELEACRVPDPAEGTLCALERLHRLAPAALGPGLADEAAKLVAQVLRPSGAVLPGVEAMVLRRQDAFQGYLEERLRRFWPGTAPIAELATSGGAGAAAARALEPWLRERAGHGLGEGAATILARNPALASLLRLHPVLGDVSAGRLQAVSRQEVVSQFHSFFGTLVDSAHAAVRTVGGPGGAGQPTDLAGWAARRSLVYLAARAGATAGDGALPASLSALGNAAVDLHRGLGDLPSSLASVGRSAAAFALTGNVLGIASSMTALLNLGGGSHGMAAAEVRALRGVVDSLRVEVDGRFDHLDAAVAGVLDEVSGGFERLERAVAMSGEASRREIAAVHAEMNALHQRVDRLDANIQSYLNAGFDRDYARTLARCLEHRERFAPPHDQLDFATFSGCLVEFRSRGVADARDALLSDRDTPAGDDAALLAALADTSRHNLARRLPLVARAAALRHGHTAPPAALANALEWAVAAEAYVRMLDDWPAHAAAITTADLDALIGVGRELDDWSRRLTTDEAARPRGQLFDAALRDYAAGAAELRAAVESFTQRQQEGRLQRIPPDSLVRRITPTGDGPVLDVPRGLVERVPNDALAAAMLGLHPLELRYHVLLRDSVTRDNFRRPFLRGTRHQRHHYALPVIVIEATVAGSTVMTFEATGAPIRHRTDEMAGDERSDRVRSTRTLVADPAAQFLSGERARLADENSWTARPAAPATLAPFRTAVETELGRYAAQTLDDMVRSVCTGAPARADATGDADRIRRALHSMTVARALFGAYTRYGLSRSLGFDPALAELLGSDRGLYDQGAVCGRLQRGEGMLRVLWLDDEPARAGRRAGSYIASRFNDAAALPEPLESVATTLERLEAARRIQRARSANGG